MSNLAATIGDARKRIELEHADDAAMMRVATRLTLCRCGHPLFSHYIIRGSLRGLACLCGCLRFEQGLA